MALNKNIKFKPTKNFEVVYMHEVEKWNRILNNFDNIDTYYTVGYSKTFMIHGDGTPVLLYYKNDGLEAINVVMVRTINSIRYIELDINKEYFDLSSPYGYGGFVIKGKDDKDHIKQFNEDYIEFCNTNNIICEFARFHPVLENCSRLIDVYDVVFLGNTVEMDLSNEETIWENITSKNRNVIRKAIKNDVKIYHGFSMELLEEFREMYNKTMDRDHAKEYYYFEKEFYKTALLDCNEDMTVFYAEYKGKKISMAIILKRNKQLHYHLSASEYEYRRLAPTNLLLWEVAKWGCKNKFNTFHLGGGVGGDINDSLYKFKKSFNRSYEREFYIGKKIFDPNVYSMLVDAAEKTMELDASFFPLYRAGINV